MLKLDFQLVQQQVVKEEEIFFYNVVAMFDIKFKRFFLIFPKRQNFSLRILRHLVVLRSNLKFITWTKENNPKINDVKRGENYNFIYTTFSCSKPSHKVLKLIRKNKFKASYWNQILIGKWTLIPIDNVEFIGIWKIWSSSQDQKTRS